jgi:pyoverdine/dityrosine biosynthesis protein Dit1
MDNGYHLYNAIQRLIFEHDVVFPDPQSYERFMRDLANIFEL